MHALLTKMASSGLPAGLAPVFGDFADNLTAAGTTQATAWETSTAIARFTTVASGTGCLLDNGAQGDSQLIINAGANALTVYPHAGGNIEGASSFSIAAGASASFYRVSSARWIISSGGKLRADLAASGGSALVGYTRGGTSAVTRSVQDKLRERFVAPEDFGAVGDGIADDRAAIVAALAVGSVCLTPEKNYRITARIDVPNGRWIVGPRSATVTMDAATFNITSPVNYGATNGVGFLLNALTSGGLEGFRVRMSAQGAELCAGAVVMRGCTSAKVRVHGMEFDNFSKSKVVRVESSTECQITKNYIHDCLLQSATTGQLTGIDVDDNRPSGGSERLRIDGNTVSNLTCSAAFITSFGYQTDAINVSHEDSIGHSIQNNIIDNVGEGVDVFGAECTVSGNHIRDPYLVGVKLIHGARRNTVTANTIIRPGLGGIYLSATNTAVNHIEDNIVANNNISYVNNAGNWNAGTTHGVRLDDDAGTKFARRNKIIGNKITNGDAMKYGIVSGDGATGNVISDNDVSVWTVAEFSAGGTAAATEQFKSSKTAWVRAWQSASQSIPSATVTQVLFATEDRDSQGEFASSTYTAKSPRRLLVRASVRTGGAASGQLWNLRLRKSGVVVDQIERHAGGPDFSIDLCSLVSVTTGDTLDIRVFQNSAAAISLTAATEFTNIQITEV